MLRIQLTGKDSPLHILCLGAHSDDIEIGCGAAILTLKKQYTDLQFTWIVFSADKIRAVEARQSAKRFLGKCKKKIIVKSFRDAFFPYYGEKIKSYFEEIRKICDPDLIFTHYRHDGHQDHRAISEWTYNAFRNHVILEYEIMKYDGDLGRPNFYVEISQEILAKKNQYIYSTFKSQINNHWFHPDNFTALARLRGIEINAFSGFAEAFHCRKLKIL